MDWIIYSSVILEIFIFLLISVVFFYYLDIVYKLKIENVFVAFNRYSNFKKDFIVLKGEYYKFYTLYIFTFILGTALYIGLSFLIRAIVEDQKTFLVSIITFWISYIIYLFIVNFYIYLLFKKLKKIKVLSKEEALISFEKFRQEMPKNLTYKTFQIKYITEIKDINFFFQRAQKILKRKILALKKNEDNYKKIKIFLWYIRANSYLISRLRNLSNLQIEIDQSVYEYDKIPEILVENFFSVLDKEELILSETQNILV